MKSAFLPTLKLYFWMVVLTGLVYPLLITLVAQVTMKHKADGGFLEVGGKVVGARLIAQKFQSDRYFWPRPSSGDYNALSSGGSNLGPTSLALKKAIDERQAALEKGHGKAEIPSELLYASGSGLDPHISPKAALYQSERVAKARGLDKQKVIDLIDKYTEHPSFGFMGEPVVNVLNLNIALDGIKHG